MGIRPSAFGYGALLRRTQLLVVAYSFSSLVEQRLSGFCIRRGQSQADCILPARRCQQHLPSHPAYLSLPISSAIFALRRAASPFLPSFRSVLT